jgi:hypothetical protein
MGRRRGKKAATVVASVAVSLGPPYLRRWMRYALLGSLLAGAAAGAWFYDYQSKWMHYPPKPDIRFQAIARKLKALPNVSPSEEYPGPNDETTYLTEDQFKAVNAAASLPGDVNKRLARALSEPDPDRQAELLFQLVDGAPKTPDGDASALSLFYLASAALSAPPHTPARVEARRRLDEMIGCRFYPVATMPPMNLPACSRRPGLVPLYVLAGLAAAPLIAILGSLLATMIRRPRIHRRPTTQGAS